MNKLFKPMSILAATVLFMTACSTPGTQAPPVVPPTSVPTVAVTMPTTSPAISTMKKLWETNGNPNAFNLPTELAIDLEGNAYIIDGGNHRVQKYDKNGNFLLMWGGSGAGDGQFFFRSPPAHYGGLTVDKDGYVYVTDHHNRVQKFDGNGAFLMKFGTTGSSNGEFYDLYGVAVDDQGNIYTTDLTKYEIQKFNSQGEFLQKWAVPSCKPGGIPSPTNLVVDRQGQLYATNQGGNCIQKFDTLGNLLQQWGETGESDGQFYQPLSIALDGHGNVYVSDNKNGRIQKFDSNGNFLAVYGPFEFPDGIAVDQEGYVYVVEVGLGRLQKLRLE